MNTIRDHNRNAEKEVFEKIDRVKSLNNIETVTTLAFVRGLETAKAIYVVEDAAMDQCGGSGIGDKL